MEDENKYLKNLPKADRNFEISTESLKAFNSILPSDRFCFRAETVADFGVDGSLELLVGGKATNFRADVQLKGTRFLKPNKDGSYSLGDIATSNLQYLLNGKIPIYVLHLQEVGEFRYVWARDEFKRLENENPDWLNQDTVTIRFRETLDLDRIRERVVRETTFGRNINELIVLSERSSVRLEIDAVSLEITDEQKLFEALIKAGLSMTNEGHGLLVLEKIGSLNSEHREHPEIKLLRAYGEFIQGRYRTAIESIETLNFEGCPLPAVKQLIAEWVQNAASYQTGAIDSDTYIENLRSLAEKQDPSQFSAYKFEYLRRRLLDEQELTARNELEKQLIAEFEKLSVEEAKSEQVLPIKFQILESQLGSMVLEMSSDLYRTYVRQKTFGILATLPDVREVVDKWHSRTARWFEDLDKFSSETANPILHADIAVQKVMTMVHQLSLVRFVAGLNHLELPPISDGVFKECSDLIAFANERYSHLKLHERLLKAEAAMAEVTAFRDGKSLSRPLFDGVFARSKKMGYVHVEHVSTNPISEIQDRIAAKNAETTVDDMWAALSDGELRSHAVATLKDLGVPDERLPHALTEMRSRKHVAIERLAYCDQLELVEDLAHMKSPETIFARPMIFYGRCLRFGHESNKGHGESQTTLDTFKRIYCSNCSNRTPKNPS